MYVLTPNDTRTQTLSENILISNVGHKYILEQLVLKSATN